MTDAAAGAWRWSPRPPRGRWSRTPPNLVQVDPGYVDTEINNHSGYLTVAQGAAVLVRLATLGVVGPTGGFFSEDGPVPW
ncbi:Rossmann-fold NAD(P)-binding domain-containing protein [Streptomyces mirabilis]|uniref:hypothetical protein n=1 Tax=Streptomyces mirabilis TaxID=68239 RepID=UPI0036F0E9F5